MKFLVTKELHQNPLLSKLVLFFVLILSVFLITDLVLHHLQIGLIPAQALETLQGNEEAFIEPLLFDVLLERVHIGIFTSMITLVLLSIILMRVTEKQNDRSIHFAFITAILAPVALLLGYFYGVVFVTLWIVLFTLWHLLGIYFSLVITWRLLRP